jgi:hypothetical protein
VLIPYSELEAIQLLGLFRLGGNPPRHHVRGRLRLFGGQVEHYLELARLKRSEPVAVLQVTLDPGNVLRATHEMGQLFVGAPGPERVGRVTLDDVGVRLPLSQGAGVAQPLILFAVTGEVVLELGVPRPPLGIGAAGDREDDEQQSWTCYWHGSNVHGREASVNSATAMGYGLPRCDFRQPAKPPLP